MCECVYVRLPGASECQPKQHDELQTVRTALSVCVCVCVCVCMCVFASCFLALIRAWLEAELCNLTQRDERNGE